MLANVNLDSFSSGQIQSKLWLIRELEECLVEETKPQTVWLLAGWYGLTNLLIRTRGRIPILEVRSFDSDPECEPIADRINNLWEWQGWQFKAFTKDINDLEWSSPPDIVINTSCEHIHSQQWFWDIPEGTVVAIQGNNMEHIDHVAQWMSLEDFQRDFPMGETLYTGSREFVYEGEKPWTRFMLIGIK